MKQTHILFFIGACLIFFLPRPSQATSCFVPSCKDSLTKTALVFKGKAITNGSATEEMKAEYAKNKDPNNKSFQVLPDTYTDFEVLSLYKGFPREIVRVFYAVHRRGPIAGDSDVPPYPVGQEAVVYASKVGGFYLTYRGLCSGCSGSDELDTIKTQYDALEDLILKYPKTSEFYLKKIALYDENKDFEAAVFTYERAFTALPSIKEKPEYMAAYGRALFLSGRDKEAIDVLEPLKTDVDALSYLQQSRLRMDAPDQASILKLEMSGKEVTNLTISDKDLSGSNFSGAKLEGIKFINVKLQGADFTGAVIHGEISGSDLSGSKLDGVQFRGIITDSILDNASLKKSTIDLDSAGGNSFVDADFTSSKLDNMGCRFVKDWRGSNFTRANFTDATVSGLGKSSVASANFTRTNFFANKCVSRNEGVDLSGKNFDDAKFDLGDYTGGSFRGSSLRNVTFIGDNLTGVDFRGADLTGANFTTSTYNGPVKLHGADLTDALIEGAIWTGAHFDCKTKFPKGFKPEEHQMETRDTSCESASSKNPGVVNYDADRLSKGYMTVCNGDYHADCLYGFLASYYMKQQSWSYQKELERFTLSFLEAGYPELAKIIPFKMIGAIALSRHSLDSKEILKWYQLIKQIENSPLVPHENETVDPAKQDVEELLKSLNRDENRKALKENLELARKYLSQGNKAYARAIALYGIKGVDNYPQASGKADFLLPYTSIIARTELKMSDAAQKKIEDILREVHPNVPGAKVDPTMASLDFVAEGQMAYKELERRLAHIKETNTGETTSLPKQGVLYSAKEIEEQMSKWLEGAIKKYNHSHPDTPISISAYAANEMMNKMSAGNSDSWFNAKNPRPFWIDKGKPGDYIPIHMYGSNGHKYFVVPADVSRPSIPRKEATYFFVSDFTCEGDFQPFCKY